MRRASAGSNRWPESYRDRRDYTQTEVRRAIRELAACLDIYRTYVVPDRKEITDEDRMHLAQATECAKTRRQDIDPSLFDFMRGVLPKWSINQRCREIPLLLAKYKEDAGIAGAAALCLTDEKD